MKKLSVLAIALAAAGSMSAQTALVKEAEKAFKAVDSYASYQKALQQITPAFSNPETDKNAQTYWIPGKAGFKLYDDLYGQKALGKNINMVDMSNALLDGYDYGLKALDCDSVADAKGKIKTKYSKDIVAQIVGHFNDFQTAGVVYWQEQDYKKAYQAFNTYLAIAGNPRFGKDAPAALPDTIVSQITFNEALAAWQAEMLPQAAAAFDKLITIGMDDPNSYDYAFSVAYQMKDEARKLKYSQAALDKFGTSDPKFLQRVVNYYIDSKDYQTAIDMLNKAIQADPNNGAYQFSMGILLESQGKQPEAMAAYEKAVALNPDDALSNLYYGKALAQENDRLDAASGDMSQADYNKFRAETIVPLLQKSASYLEKAYQLNDELTDALLLLKNIYYVLQDGDNLNRVEALLK